MTQLSSILKKGVVPSINILNVSTFEIQHVKNVSVRKRMFCITQPSYPYSLIVKVSVSDSEYALHEAIAGNLYTFINYDKFKKVSFDIYEHRFTNIDDALMAKELIDIERRGMKMYINER
jgi:hypothetical protein